MLHPFVKLEETAKIRCCQFTCKVTCNVTSCAPSKNPLPQEFPWEEVVASLLSASAGDASCVRCRMRPPCKSSYRTRNSDRHPPAVTIKSIEDGTVRGMRQKKTRTIIAIAHATNRALRTRRHFRLFFFCGNDAPRSSLTLHSHLFLGFQRTVARHARVERHAGTVFVRST